MLNILDFKEIRYLGRELSIKTKRHPFGAYGAYLGLYLVVKKKLIKKTMNKKTSKKNVSKKNYSKKKIVKKLFSQKK